MCKGTSKIGQPSDPVKPDEAWHIEGDLQVFDGAVFKKQCDCSLFLLHAGKGLYLIVIRPLTRSVTCATVTEGT